MRGLIVCATAVLVALSAAPAASPHAGHGPLEIDIANFGFAPQNVLIYQGDSVVFTWKGPDTNHSATSETFDSDADKPSATVVHSVGDTYGVSFSKLGTYTYHCKVHASMTGTIKVDPIPGAPVPTAPKLTNVSLKQRTFAHATTARFTLDGPASMRASLRKGSKTVKELDFNAHPGQNTKKLEFGKKVKPGKYALKLVAIDPSSGKSSKPASISVTVRRTTAKASARSYPAITCGRVTMNSKRYVVKSHGPSCTTAIRGVKGWVAHHKSPRYYKCKTIGGDIPAYCIGAVAKYSKRYFFASKA